MRKRQYLSFFLTEYGATARLQGLFSLQSSTSLLSRKNLSSEIVSRFMHYVRKCDSLALTPYVLFLLAEFHTFLPLSKGYGISWPNGFFFDSACDQVTAYVDYPRRMQENPMRSHEWLLFSLISRACEGEYRCREKACIKGPYPIYRPRSRGSCFSTNFVCFIRCG